MVNFYIRWYLIVIIIIIIHIEINIPRTSQMCVNNSSTDLEASC